MSTVAQAVEAGVLPGRVWMYSNYHCNLACSYCLTESAPKSPRRELGAERMVEVAVEARDLGFTAPGITGGEPFLLPHMPETIARLASVLPVVVLTNGTLFSPSRLEPHASARRSSRAGVQISLDSADPVANDAMRGPDNWRKVIEALPALVRLGVGVRIGTTGEEIDEDHVVRPIVRRGRAVDNGLGVFAEAGDLPPELTITADGAFWSPFGPTVHGGRLDTDLLVTRATAPLSRLTNALLRLVSGRPAGNDSTLHIR